MCRITKWILHKQPSVFLPSDHEVRSSVYFQWCGLRPSDLGHDSSDTKKIGLGLAYCGLDLAGLVLCFETRPCHARRHNDLEGHSNFSSFQVLFIVSLFCAWNITTVESNSGVHLLKSQIRQVPLFISGGLGLGLKNLVLFTPVFILHTDRDFRAPVSSCVPSCRARSPPFSPPSPGSPWSASHCECRPASARNHPTSDNNYVHSHVRDACREVLKV